MVEVKVYENVLRGNDAIAAEVESELRKAGVYSCNIISSPGSGKTTMLERTAKSAGELRMGVIEGDLQTTRDADRIAAAGAMAVQIKTRGACHLDASMIKNAMTGLDLGKLDIMIIENVGNLICPATYKLGEKDKVVLVSVTEGEDKPGKYPSIFREASLMVVNKIDLLPHLDFNVDNLEKDARAINPDIEIIRLSSKTGEGFDSWMNWLNSRVAETKA